MEFEKHNSSIHPKYLSIPKGILVAVGGNEDKRRKLEVLRTIVDLMDMKNPIIELITTASSIPEESGKKYVKAFNKLGISNIRLMHIKTRDEANDPKFVKRIMDANFIYFTGGDQLRITSILGGSPVLVTIKKKYFEEKCVIGGTSAGASAMPDTMIYEGESPEALFKGTVQMTAGIGLVKNVVIDSHFIKRGRFSRLMETVTTNPGRIGLGLGEDSGVIIRKGHILEAIGNGLVVIFDGQHITYSNISEIEMGEAIAVQNVIVHTLVKGYGYDLLTRDYLKPSDLLMVNI
jgi:cyanophycinase